MHFKYLLILFSAFLMGCSHPDPKEMATKLSGYWEIKEVEMPSGNKKNFNISPIVDHIEIMGDEGIRTKVSPNIDGTFTTNGDHEKFVVKIENDSLNLYYSTPFDKWKETVLEATDENLKIVNRDNKVYLYSKFEKFELPKEPTSNQN